MSEKEVRQLSIRLPRDVYEKAQKVAKKKGMTLNSLIAQIVTEHFEKEDVLEVLIRRIERLEKEVFGK